MCGWYDYYFVDYPGLLRLFRLFSKFNKRKITEQVLQV